MKKTKKNRLHIGAVFPSLDNTDKYRLLLGIEDYTKEKDIHLTSFFGTYEAKKHDFASHYEPCFEAIKRSADLDGLVIFSGFIAHNIGTDVFMSSVRSISENIPVVSIGLEIPGAYCVLADNVTGMYNAVEHLIKVHGKKRIATIKGPDEHPEVEARMTGYLNALKDNGIEYDENLVVPGNWMPYSGTDAVIELLDKRKTTFDAISSTDDDSAIFAIKELINRGYSVPEDIAVIGFNDIDETVFCEPALSSVRQDFSKYGVVAVDILCRLINGEQIDSTVYTIPELIIRNSCGCTEYDRSANLHQIIRPLGEKRRRMVADNLLLQFNIDSLGNTLREYLPIVSLNFSLVGVYRTPIKMINAQNDRSIETLFGFDGTKRINITDTEGGYYPFSDLLSINNLNFERERRSLFFLPLFFGDEESGEAIIAYDNFNPVEWYEALRRNVAVAIKGASLLEKIQALSITDELTGLLNRRGFFQHVYARILYLQRASDNLPVVFALDMDGLKYVNDTYGHAEGDVSIIAFADILKASMRMEDIIGRLGGDEFVVFSVVKAEADIAKLETRIRQKLDEYNALNKHPYRVGASIGSAPLAMPTNEAFDQAMLEADNVLYEEKQEKRKKGLTRK